MIMLPPSLLRMGFRGSQHRFGLWIPLFLLWPLLLVIFVIALVVSVIADVITFLIGARYHNYTRLLFACCGLFDALRGTTVFVDNPDTKIDFRIV